MLLPLHLHQRPTWHLSPKLMLFPLHRHLRPWHLSPKLMLLPQHPHLRPM
jgi:hypothetical protein